MLNHPSGHPKNKEAPQEEKQQLSFRGYSQNKNQLVWLFCEQLRNWALFPRQAVPSWGQIVHGWRSVPGVLCEMHTHAASISPAASTYSMLRHTRHAPALGREGLSVPGQDQAGNLPGS